MVMNLITCAKHGYPCQSIVVGAEECCVRCCTSDIHSCGALKMSFESSDMTLMRHHGKAFVPERKISSAPCKAKDLSLWHNKNGSGD